MPIERLVLQPHKHRHAAPKRNRQQVNPDYATQAGCHAAILILSTQESESYIQIYYQSAGKNCSSASSTFHLGRFEGAGESANWLAFLISARSLWRILYFSQTNSTWTISRTTGQVP